MSRITARIIRALKDSFARRGRGSRSRVQRQLGVSDKFFRRWEKQDVKIDLHRLEQALDALEVGIEEFFCEAFGCGNKGAGSTPEDFPLAKRVRELAGAGSRNASSGEPQWFRVLEKLRYNNAKAAVKLGEEVLGQIGGGHLELAYFCAPVGDALRTVGRFEDGRQIFDAGLCLVEEHTWLHISLMQRKATLYGELREYDLAFPMAHEAIYCAVVANDTSSIGKLLLTVSYWYAAQGEFNRSNHLIERALKLLPENELRYQCSARIYLGLNHRAVGQVGKATEYLRHAETWSTGLESTFSTSVSWLHGELLAASGKAQDAIRVFQDLLTQYRKDGKALDAATACVQLVRLQLACRRADEAMATAKSSIDLISGLKRHPLAEAAIIELICCGAEVSRLSREKVEKFWSLIREARVNADLKSTPSVAADG